MIFALILGIWTWLAIHRDHSGADLSGVNLLFTQKANKSTRSNSLNATSKVAGIRPNRSEGVQAFGMNQPLDRIRRKNPDSLNYAKFAYAKNQNNVYTNLPDHINPKSKSVSKTRYQSAKEFRDDGSRRR